MSLSDPFYSHTKTHTIIHTYKRLHRKFVLLATIAFFLLSSFFMIKIFSPGHLSLSMKVTEYINKEMDRILQYKEREKQNSEFKRLVPKHPIEPIRMTLTTAVFKYTGVTPNVILKRIIHNPANGLNEDYMSMSLNSPYICKTLKTFRTKRRLSDGTEQTLLWIFFEYLDVKISQKNVAGDEEQIRRILGDALRGLEYLHSQNIAHLDLKIGNIMGKSTEKGVVYRLIDFGYSQLMPSSGSVIIPKKNYGTYPYKPPEVVFKNEHGLKSDIWSLGAICWFLSLQYTPFYFEGYEKDMASYRKFLKKRESGTEGSKNHRFVFNKNSSVELKDFVKKCMQIDPEMRPSVKELLMHPFIMGKKGKVEYNSEDEMDDFSNDEFSTGSLSTQ